MTTDAERSPAATAARSLILRVISVVDFVVAVVFVVLGFPLAVLSRLSPRRIDVGLGPEPLINNVYHKRALASAGYSAETFVDQVYYITSDFDVRADRAIPRPLFFLRGYWLFVRALFRYKALYIYFNGGPLMNKPLLWRIEPWLYRAAGIPVVVMPYGLDVQDMTRSPNLLFKHAMAVDYPSTRFRRKRTTRLIDVWTLGAAHVIGGVEWVDYLYHWDTLMLGHFSIDTEQWRPEPAPAEDKADRPLRILHAPNHRTIKGTEHFVRAVDELRAEGVAVELVMLERVPNDKIREVMASVDVVADQLVVGWYAMFALEAMAMGKPVLCFLRPDLIDLYAFAGLMGRDEAPLVRCDPFTVKDVIRGLADDRTQLAGLGVRGRVFVEAHHSLAFVGGVFARINRSLGVEPGRARTERV
jgi:glycosyltransferase involved in cell wall biosynthesis